MAGLAVHLAHCCGPVVGDPVQGFITRSRGVTVHRKDCRNLRYVTQTERLVDVEWGTPAQFYEAKIAIEAWDRVGLLRDITTLVSAEKVNIAAVNSTHHKGGTVIEQLTLHTRDAGQLSRLLSRLEAVRGVIHVERQG
jgi:GTP pyrophosphokinase